MRLALLVMVGWVVCAGGRVAARPDGVFDVDGRPAVRAVVTTSAALPEVSGVESEMTRALLGVLADLRGRSMEALRATVPPNPALGDASGPTVAVVHLFAAEAGGKAGVSARRVEVRRAPDGGFVALRQDEGGRIERVTLRGEAFGALVRTWQAYRGGFGEVTLARGQVVTLDRPYVAGRVVFTPEVLSARMNGGSRTNLEGTTRDLSQATMFARLPARYDPREPAGLLIWLDPTASGRPPSVFESAADAGNLIVVGVADAGNNRLVVDRYQFAFDLLATASERFHVDPRRVYLTGMSGGGRVASILLGCFPETFAGAVPIVGMSFYQRVPNGVGKFWPAAYQRPAAEAMRVLRTRRIGAITGEQDFNQREMENTIDLMQRDGLSARLWRFARMGHEMPTAERFAEALAWVDDPWQRAREEESSRAAAALGNYVARFGETAPTSEASRRVLIRVTEIGPWTEAAWKAVRLLGTGPRATGTPR